MEAADVNASSSSSSSSSACYLNLSLSDLCAGGDGGDAEECLSSVRRMRSLGRVASRALRLMPLTEGVVEVALNLVVLASVAAILCGGGRGGNKWGGGGGCGGRLGESERPSFVFIANLAVCDLMQFAISFGVVAMVTMEKERSVSLWSVWSTCYAW